MKITIEQANNGYIVFYPDYMSDGSGADKEVTKCIVVEEKDGEFGEQEAFVRLSLELMDLLGVNNSKHNRRRINIGLTDGDEEV